MKIESERAGELERSLVIISIYRVMLAVPAELVVSVSAVPSPTPLPGAPAHILGLVASGERALPLVDLEVMLAIRGDEPIDPLFRRVVFVRAPALEAGLVCHRARGLVSVPGSALEEPSVLQGERLRPFLEAEVSGQAGVVGVVGVLDIAAVLEAAAVA